MSNNNIEIKTGGLSYSFLSSGDLYAITKDNLLINQQLSNTIDGSMQNIYLRIIEDNGQIIYHPLLGVHSESTFYQSDHTLKWVGTFSNVHYEVIFHAVDYTWFWEVNLEGNNNDVDIIYGQDLGLAELAAVRSNEAYVSQYIDHTVFEDEQVGYTICSRQNQPQNGRFPFIQQGTLNKATGYSTDGFQFFGISYKLINLPEVLSKRHLAKEVYQYEFAYTALQTEAVTLKGKDQFVFYGSYRPNQPPAITKMDGLADIMQTWESIQSKPTPAYQQVEINANLFNYVSLNTLPLTEEELNAYYPIRQLEEYKNGNLLSFFTNQYEHVVLKEKERWMERPHGHILMSGSNDQIRDDVFTTTSYMYGIFNSQLSVGNVEMNKLSTNARNPLNIHKTSGQRIYIEIDKTLHLLAMPSAFEMGFNYCKWYYKTEQDLLIVTNFTAVATNDVQLQVQSASGKSYRYFVTQQIDHTKGFIFTNDQATGTYLFNWKEKANQVYPDLQYRMKLPTNSKVFQDNNSTSLVCFTTDKTDSWSMVIEGQLKHSQQPLQVKDFTLEKERYRIFFHDVMRGFHLSMKGDTTEYLEKTNAIAWWYTHNMLVHFSTPHGLEQYGGAAWGTRDVSQGPFEYFMATRHYQTAKEIIKTIYSHQYQDSGDWPQWFMFDQYVSIQQEDSHGDIIIWPLKIIGDYIEATGNFTLLEEKVPYMDRLTKNFSAEEIPIIDHLRKQINYITSTFLHNTSLPAYDDGDWDDTLQPANQDLKQYMVSTWSVALMYQSMKKLATLLTTCYERELGKLKDIVLLLQNDIEHYILDSDVIPGFIYMEDPSKVKKMLHPSDHDTGIQYRLLPMQRAIISELFSSDQANMHYGYIKKHLFFPDGVRLMNRPASYNGGVSYQFKRAEQASNFGREIGLQYVHAHIRFIEAMAKLGKEEEVWNGLNVINPILLNKSVPNADIRQSNAYFSSSDGKFHTRYEALEKFNQLKDGSVKVKGGWRIYSSGPGIFMNQLISNVLGIREVSDALIIDPIILRELNQLMFDFQYEDQPVTFIYYTSSKEKRVYVNNHKIAFKKVQNRYRNNGFKLYKKELLHHLNGSQNIIKVYL
ncbi:GH36-type glycosyl hydrolase domain-containing protein [Gracilibacillus dipsosauri]|uniref:Cellobiose phosphorylase n=1 Tax=Gracilibacillus dipsosauri TaxID=178340 RepID=A0A317KT30_9BACI|nr:cellobiose phosphorylase [Gracilibacillus dipsosauri]PWU66605.1 cellobiose phosphorylase [Gracilibacillus dipsosauri]